MPQQSLRTAPMPDALCPHLRPALAALLADGARIVDCRVAPATGALEVQLDTVLRHRDVGTRLPLPDGVTWYWADPHYGHGNGLLCTHCRHSLEGPFYADDPGRTLGE